MYTIKNKTISTKIKFLGYLAEFLDLNSLCLIVSIYESKKFNGYLIEERGGIHNLKLSKKVESLQEILFMKCLVLPLLAALAYLMQSMY